MMMGRSQNQNQNQRGSSTSSSRLSASAKPFTMNHLTNPLPKSKFSSFASPVVDPSLDDSGPTNCSVSGLEPFSLLNLGEDNFTVSAYDYSGYHSAVPFDHPQEVGPEPYYPHYLSEGFQDHSDFDIGFGSLTISKTSQPIHAPNQLLSIGVGEQGKRVDNQGSFCWIEVNDDGLRPSETSPKQGKAFAAEELNSCREASNTLERTYINVTEKYNQTTFWGTELIDAKSLSLPANGLTPSKFSTSSDLHSVATANDIYQSQVSYRKPVVSQNSFTLGSSSSEGSFSHIDTYSVKTTVPHSEGKSYFPFVFGSSGTNPTSSPKTRVFPDNFNFGVKTAVNNQNSLSYGTASLKELYYIQSAESKGKNMMIDKPESIEPPSTSKLAKSAPQSTSANLTDNFSLKHQDAEMRDPVENSSSSFDINNGDLDLDSPCWKGTQNSLRSPFGVSQPVDSHLGENEVEAHNSLNPMAPHFFPCYGKSSLCQTSFIENDITYFQQSPCSADNLLSRENELTNSITIGSCSPETKVCSESNAENQLLNILNFGSVLNSSHMAQPYFVEEHFTSKDKVASEVSTFVSFTAAECEPSSSLSGAGFPTNISKTFQDVPNSLHRSSGINGHMLVDAMSDLSELLVQNFSNDLDPLDGLDHDAIQHIINNLYACIRNRDGQRTLLPESTCPETSYCLEKSTDLQKAVH